MEKEDFNKKRSIFCGPLEKELRKRLVKCFVWSVALYGAETWTHDGMCKNEWKHLRFGNSERWTDKIKNAVVLERVEEGRIMLELITNRKRKIGWATG